MSKIDLNSTFQDVIIYVSEGNPGALQICMTILKEDKIIDPDAFLTGIGTLLRLDDMNIRGSKIWILFKDICEGKISHFLGLLRANQLGYLSDWEIYDAINNSRGKITFDKKEVLQKVKDRLPNFKLEE